jgi:hypothetical protein
MKKRITSITHEELRKAIALYLARGGRILQLPEQKTVSTAVVGRRWSSTEIEWEQLH